MTGLRFAAAAVLAIAAATPTASSAASSAPGYHIVDRIPMSDGWWDYAYFEPVHRRLFVTRGNGVFKMDVDSGQIDQRVVPGSEGRAIISLPDGDIMLTTMAGYSAAIVFAAEDGTVAKKIRLKQSSDAAVYEPVTKRVWAMGGHGEAAILDPVALTQTGALDLGEELEFAQANGKGSIFVNGSDSRSVIAIDATAQKIIGRWKMKGCEDPTGMAYVKSLDVILSVCANKLLKVLDAGTGSELATVPVGAHADAVIYDETAKIGRAHV